MTVENFSYEIEKWAQGKPIIIAIIAHQIVTSAEPYSEYLSLLKAGKHPEGYHKIPPPKVWLSFYKKHRDVNKEIINIFKSFGAGKYRTYISL